MGRGRVVSQLYVCLSIHSSSVAKNIYKEILVLSSPEIVENYLKSLIYITKMMWALCGKGVDNELVTFFIEPV